MNFSDYPQAATNNAKRALKYLDESGNPNGCLTPVGFARANQLAKREPISIDTVKRMAAFNRHRQNKDVPYTEGCGGLAWDAWGGSAGVDWAIRTSERVEREKRQAALQDAAYLSGNVGGECIEPNEVKRILSTKPERVFLNSYGGSVMDGFAVADLIRMAGIEVIGTGVVASAATVVLLAAKRALLTPTAFFMIHNPWVSTDGDAAELREQADTLEELQESYLHIYVNKIYKNGKLLDGSVEQTAEMVREMMNKETWLTAAKAFELGLVDGIYNDEIPEAVSEAVYTEAAAQRVEAYARVPQALSNKIKKFRATMEANNENKKAQNFKAAFLEFFGFSDAKEDDSKQPEAKAEAPKTPKAMTKEEIAEIATAVTEAVMKKYKEGDKEAKAMEDEEMKDEEKKPAAKASTDDKIKALQEEINRMKAEGNRREMSEPKAEERKRPDFTKDADFKAFGEQLAAGLKRSL